VAYVRFASVYRSFQDLNEFKEEIERLSVNGNETPDPVDVAKALAEEGKASPAKGKA